MFNNTVCNIFPLDNSLLLWLTYKTEEGVLYYVVSDMFRNEYYLFKGKRRLAKKSSNPCDLYKYMK